MRQAGPVRRPRPGALNRSAVSSARLHNHRPRSHPSRQLFRLPVETTTPPRNTKLLTPKRTLPFSLRPLTYGRALQDECARRVSGEMTIAFLQRTRAVVAGVALEPDV